MCTIPVARNVESATQTADLSETFYLQSISESALSIISGQAVGCSISEFDMINAKTMFGRYYRLANQYINRYYRSIN